MEPKKVTGGFLGIRGGVVSKWVKLFEHIIMRMCDCVCSVKKGGLGRGGVFLNANHSHYHSAYYLTYFLHIVNFLAVLFPSYARENVDFLYRKCKIISMVK